MIQRSTLATIARSDALKCYHGFVMETEPNLDPIVQLFPPWPLREWDGKWCAAFVYYCCRLAGLGLPVRYPDDRVSCNFAGCLAWEQWAMLPETGFYHRAGEEGFVPEAGDIVLYDGVFDPGPHDHIGVVLENREASLLVAEGNYNNVSAVLERKKDVHIRAYLRIPDRYTDGQATIV